MKWSEKLQRKTALLLMLLIVVANIPISMVTALGEPMWSGGIDTSWYSDSGTQFTINTPEEFAGFSALAAQDKTFAGKTVRLGADIYLNEGNFTQWMVTGKANKWTPIKKFSGTFDGQNHTINGLYIDSGAGVQGLFSEASNAVIRNVRLVNSYISAGSNSGSIVGNSTGDSTYENIYTNAYITGTGTSIGGVVGLGGSGSSGKITINSTWFDGFAYSKGSYAGGLVGNANNTPISSSNCMNTGTVIGDNQAGAFAGRNGANTNITNFYSSVATLGRVDASGYISEIIGNFAGNTLTVSGCYYLSGGAAAYQSSGTPTYVGTPVALTLAQMTGNNASSNMTAFNFDTVWMTVSGSTPQLRIFSDITPSAKTAQWSGLPDTSWYKASESTYTINTMAQLSGLAVITTIGRPLQGKTVNLGADITMNTGNHLDWIYNPPTYGWLPISFGDPGFQGTFDGKGHTISGLYYDNSTKSYVGFFGRLNGATVKDIVFKNSLIAGNSNIGGLAGAIISNPATISGIYSDAYVKVSEGLPTGGASTGGLVGVCASAGVQISKCWFDGSVKSASKYVGGIIGNGNGQAISVSDCMNTGAIYGLDEVGGIVGRSGGLSASLTNCYSTGPIASTDNKFANSLFGDYKNGGTLTVIGSYYPLGCTPVGLEGTSSLAGTIYAKSMAQMTGAAASTNMSALDFTNTWATVTGETPRLQKFLSLSRENYVYSADKIEHPMDMLKTLNIPYGISGSLNYAESQDNGDYLMVIGDTGAAQYNTAVSNLQSLGYVKYADKDIDGNKSATYTKDGSTIFIYYTPSNQSIRIIIEKSSQLSALLPDTKYVASKTTLLTQMVMDGTAMSYVIRLADGSFIIIDGGYVKGIDEVELYSILQAQSGGDPIVIAAWIFTHAHLDHTGTFANFMDSYSANVTLENLIYSFPDSSVLGLLDNPMVTNPDMLPRFNAAVTSALNADSTLSVIKPHTGQSLYFRNAKIDILFTYEDLFPGSMITVNDSSLIFTIEVDEQKILFLGDTEEGSVPLINSMYINAVKADICQVSHHGYQDFSSIRTLYAKVNPSVLLWPVDKISISTTNNYLRNSLNVEENIVANKTTTLVLPYTANSLLTFAYPTGINKTSDVRILANGVDVTDATEFTDTGFIVSVPGNGANTTVQIIETVNAATNDFNNFVYFVKKTASGYNTTQMQNMKNILGYVGASIRTNESLGQGLRFKSRISEDLKTNGSDGYFPVEYGTLVKAADNPAPLSYFTGTYQNRVGKSVAYSEADNVNLVFENKDGDIMYTAVLIGFDESLYYKDYVFVSYALMSNGVDSYVIYGNPVTKNIHGVAVQILADPNHGLSGADYDYVLGVAEYQP